MNKEIFMKIAQKQNSQEEFLPLIKSENDDLIIVLRVHLLAENLLDAWICSFAGNVDFLSLPIELNFSFSQKLNLARNMGLPSELYAVINGINKLRNKMAHNLSKKKIEDIDIEKIVKPFEQYEYRFVDIKSYELSTSDNHNKYKISCSNTPNQKKLWIVFFVLQLEIPSLFEPKINEEETKKVNIAVTFSL